MRSTNSNSKSERPNNRNRQRETRMRIGNSHQKAQKSLCLLCLFAAFSLLGLGTIAVRAQIKYARGQNIAPAFEGWEQNPDGSYNFVFGYLNRNYEEEVDIPIGPNNNIEPGGDRGQPTHFYPRRQRFVFRVTVPKDWDKQQRIVWTLTSRGRTEQAKAWLQPEWELNDEVISENNGGGVLAAGNEPPSITGSPAQTITLPDTATLTVTAKDEGLPKPNPRRTTAALSRDSNPDAEPPRRDRGVQIQWILYRGPGGGQVDPITRPIVYGQPLTLQSKVRFSTPGTDVLPAIAKDRQPSSTYNVTVTVNPAGR